MLRLRTHAIPMSILLNKQTGNIYFVLFTSLTLIPLYRCLHHLMSSPLRSINHSHLNRPIRPRDKWNPITKRIPSSRK